MSPEQVRTEVRFTPAARRSEGPRQSPFSSNPLGLQRLVRHGSLLAGVTPQSALALQRAAGNRAVARLVRKPTDRVLQRTGKIIAGSFAASVSGEEKIIQVIPWTDRDGRNNNFLYID